jgi:hypothetical protein
MTNDNYEEQDYVQRITNLTVEVVRATGAFQRANAANQELSKRVAELVEQLGKEGDDSVKQDGDLFPENLTIEEATGYAPKPWPPAELENKDEATTDEKTLATELPE